MKTHLGYAKGINKGTQPLLGNSGIVTRITDNIINLVTENLGA